MNFHGAVAAKLGITPDDLEVVDVCKYDYRYEVNGLEYKGVFYERADVYYHCLDMSVSVYLYTTRDATDSINLEFHFVLQSVPCG